LREAPAGNNFAAKAFTDLTGINPEEKASTSFFKQESA